MPPPSLDAEELVARAAAFSAPPPPEEPEAPASPAPPNVLALERAIADSTTPEQRSEARIALARAHMEQGAFGAAELCLQEGLAEGGIEEGHLLARMLEPHKDRSEELVRVRRRQVELAPGDLALLDALRQAAQDDHNPVYARAVEHTARAFDPGAGPLPPPPLSAQSEQPGLLGLLTRLGSDRVAQAFALVWESAHTLFTREASSYSLTGAERIVPSGASPLARLYEVVIRLLDTPRIPLFVRKATTPLAGSVALLWPAAAVITGTPTEDAPELRVALAHALSSALPHNAILLGLPGAETRTIYDAMLGAFGPPELGRSLDSASARLAERFWQAIPGATQRRLTDLLATARPEELGPALERARQGGRRLALFLTGDFGVTARALLDEGAMEKATLAGPNLRALCAEVPQLTDLLRLAVSPEYADARWLPMAPGSQRGNLSSSRIRLP